MPTTSFQTGYKRTRTGALLYFVALSILFGWIVLLAMTTRLQYIYTGDDRNYYVSLQWFCAVFNIGFVWSLIMYWPHSIASLFLRRCLLPEATHVAVYYEFAKAKENAVASNHLRLMPKWVLSLFYFVSNKIEVYLLLLIFTSENARVDPNKGIREFCPVRQNSDGSKYFCFLFRRYNLDERRQRFVPGCFNLGETFADLAPTGATELDQLELAYLEAIDEEADPALLKKVSPKGLTVEQVLKRSVAVGPNAIEMEPPLFVRSVAKELSTTFYLYQFYILWIWVTIQYYYMAVVNQSIVLFTSCVIAWFRYRSDCVLFRVCKVEGMVSVYRGGRLESVKQCGRVGRNPLRHAFAQRKVRHH